VKRIRPRTPVLLLTMHPEQQYARRALKAGAAGYLTKDSVPDELKTAIKKIVAGGRYVSETLAEKLAVDLRKGADMPLHELLSDREFQVLRMLASGKPSRKWRRPFSQRKDRQHLSRPNSGKDRHEDQRGPHSLRPRSTIGGLAPDELRVALRPIPGVLRSWIEGFTS